MSDMPVLVSCPHFTPTSPSPGQPSPAGLQPGPGAAQGPGQPPEQPPVPREGRAAATRIEVTIPIPLDMYQGSGREPWGQAGRDGDAAEPGLGLAGAGGTGDRPEGPKPSCATATAKEETGGRGRDEDRDVDEACEQGLPSLVGPAKSPCPAQDAQEGYDGGKSKGVLRDSPGEAGAESHEGQDQEEKAQLLGTGGAPEAALSQPPQGVSQKEAEPKEGEDSGPGPEAAKAAAEEEDGVKDEDAAVPDAGGRRTPRRKAGGPAADKASRVPLPKGVCSRAAAWPSTAACCHLDSCCLDMAWSCAVTDPPLPLPLYLFNPGLGCQTLVLRFRPLHGAGVSLIMLFLTSFCFDFLGSVGWVPRLPPGPCREDEDGMEVAQARAVGLTWRVQLVPAGLVPSGLHV